MNPNVFKIALILLLSSVCAITQGNASSSFAQDFGEASRRPDIAAAKIRTKDFSLVDLNTLKESNWRASVPDLRMRFADTEDEDKRLAVANALLSLGESDPKVWHYFEARVDAALERDAPSMLAYGADGNALKGVSPAFTAWASSQGLTDAQAVQQETDRLAVIADLTTLRNVRALPLLHRALDSSSETVVILAVIGLANLHDEAAVPAILQRRLTLPKQVSDGMAYNLLRFESAEARQAAVAVLGQDKANEAIKSLAAQQK